MTLLQVTRDISPTGFAVCRAALECESFDEVAARLQVEVANFGEVLANSPTLRDAFDRGRRLRQLKDLASTPFYLGEVARRMGLVDEVELQDLFAKDPEAKDIFTQSRHTLAIESRAALLKAAELGNAYAIKTLDRLLRPEAAMPEGQSPVDCRRLTSLQTEAITGIRRQQILRWQKSRGLKTNEDGTLDLRDLITWLRENPRIGRTRKYNRAAGAVEARIVKRIQQVITEELARGSDVEPAGE